VFELTKFLAQSGHIGTFEFEAQGEVVVFQFPFAVPSTFLFKGENAVRKENGSRNGGKGCNRGFGKVRQGGTERGGKAADDGNDVTKHRGPVVLSSVASSPCSALIQERFEGEARLLVIKWGAHVV